MYGLRLGASLHAQVARHVSNGSRSPLLTPNAAVPPTGLVLRNWLGTDSARRCVPSTCCSPCRCRTRALKQPSCCWTAPNASARTFGVLAPVDGARQGQRRAAQRRMARRSTATAAGSSASSTLVCILRSSYTAQGRERSHSLWVPCRRLFASVYSLSNRSLWSLQRGTPGHSLG